MNFSKFLIKVLLLRCREFMHCIHTLRTFRTSSPRLKTNGGQAPLRFSFSPLLPILILIQLGCPAPPTIDNDKHDPRNVTRIDNHLEVRPDITMDSERNIHIVYQGSDDYYTGIAEVYYMWKNQDNDWSAPVNLSNSSNNSTGPKIVIDSNDNIHVIWEEDTEIPGRTIYVMKTKTGEWTEPIFLTDDYNLFPQLAIDAYDNIYVSGDGFRLQYLKKTGNTWSPLEILDTIDVLNPSMAVSDDGNVFIAGEGGGKIELVTRSKETGLWHSEFISDTYAYPWVASVAEDDIVYVSWTVKYTDQIKIRMKYPNGTWSSVDSIPNIEGDPWISTLAVNEQGLHVVWNAHTEEWDYDIYYQLRTHEGVWKERQQVSFTESASLNRCVLLENNMIHIVWQEKFEKNRTSNRDIYYQILDITE